MNTEFRPEWICLPGYLGSSDLLHLGKDWRGAFERLEIFSPASAEEFLDMPAQALAQKAKSGRTHERFVISDFATMAMAFAVVAVVADRERQDEDGRRRTQELASMMTKEEQGG